METTLADIISSYTVFDNPAEYSVNYLIQGPSGGHSIYESQAKGSNKLISIADILVRIVLLASLLTDQELLD